MRCALEMLCVGLLLSLCGCGDGTSTQAPSAAEAKSALASYLVAEHQSRCQGRVTLDHLSVTRVGGFESNMGGYPIFAAYSTTCRHGASSETVNGMGQADAAAAYMRRPARGGWEAYMPDIFRRAQLQLDRQIQDALEKLEPR